MNRTMNVSLGLVALLFVSLSGHAEQANPAQHNSGDKATTGRHSAEDFERSAKDLSKKLSVLAGKDKIFKAHADTEAVPFNDLIAAAEKMIEQRRGLHEFCSSSDFANAKEFAKVEDEYMTALNKIFLESQVKENADKSVLGWKTAADADKRFEELSQFFNTFMAEKAVRLGGKDNLPQADKDLLAMVKLMETTFGIDLSNTEVPEDLQEVIDAMKSADREVLCTYVAPESDEKDDKGKNDKDDKGKEDKSDKGKTDKGKDGKSTAATKTQGAGAGTDTKDDAPVSSLADIRNAVAAMSQDLNGRLKQQREEAEDRIRKFENQLQKIEDLRRKNAQLAQNINRAQDDNNAELLARVADAFQRDNDNNRRDALALQQPQQQQFPPFFPQVSTPQGNQGANVPTPDQLAAQAGPPPIPPNAAAFGLGQNRGDDGKSRIQTFPTPAPQQNFLPQNPVPLQNEALVAARNALKANDEYWKTVNQMMNPFGIPGVGGMPFAGFPQQQVPQNAFANQLRSFGQPGFGGQPAGFGGAPGFGQPGFQPRPQQFPGRTQFGISGNATTGAAGAIAVNPNARTSTLPPSIRGGV